MKTYSARVSVASRLQNVTEDQLTEIRQAAPAIEFSTHRGGNQLTVFESQVVPGITEDDRDQYVKDALTSLAPELTVAGARQVTVTIEFEREIKPGTDRPPATAVPA